MKTHMVEVRQGGHTGTVWSPMCNAQRARGARGDGLRMTFNPAEVTCKVCQGYDLERAAKEAHEIEAKYAIKDEEDKQIP